MIFKKHWKHKRCFSFSYRRYENNDEDREEQMPGSVLNVLQASAHFNL